VIRRLAAILAADIAGYSRLMHADEEGTYARFTTLMADVIGPALAQHAGRIVKRTGDGFLAEFPSAVEAAKCSLQFQMQILRDAAREPEDRWLSFRVGIHIGDVIVEEQDIYGDGVNVAARLEALAEPGGIVISGVVHENVRGRVSSAFEDMGDQSVKNIAKPVRTYRMIPGTRRQAEPEQILALPDKPSIAVLPFQNMSGDAAQDYFVDGMTEEINTALSRVPSFFVVARHSTFAYKGTSPNIRQVGRELGIRYVLEGSVRKTGERVRISGQLIDATTGMHVWADRFDGILTDIFELQDQVAASVVGAIEPRLRDAEIERARLKPAENLQAYDLVLRSRFAEAWAASGLLRAYLGEIEVALDHLERSRRLNPRIAFFQHVGFTVAHFVAGKYDEAVNWTAAGLSRYVAHVPLLRYRAASLGLLGRSDEARQVVQRMLAIVPDLTIARARRHVEIEMKNPYKKPSVVEAYYEGLRRAGLPE
jgi:TolB-like protein